MRKIFVFSLFIVLSVFSTVSMACTNFIVTKGASADGSVMVSYAADSHQLYGDLYHYPAAEYPKGSMLKIYEWDTGKYLGEIPQVEHTYNVVGNVNEHQLAIAETTYGGRPELVNPDGIIDYGSLIYITLQRAKNAREAIKIMVELMDNHGYCSSGESFSIIDKNEAWILEVIGKGEGNKGAVWVAMLIPDGYVSAHANQARITTFPYQKKNNWNDAKQTVFNSKDVISFAKGKGYFNGKDAEFSFSDTYAPVDFGAARFCELRVWAFFNHISSGMEQYWGYATGNDIKYNEYGYATNRMPLWIKADKKLTQLDLFKFMSDHLEGTELDMSKDFGAGPFSVPYRWRPMTWELDGKNYIHERTTATQQTGFSFIAQLRGWLPDPIGALNWFGADDAATTIYVPMYASIKEIPYPFRTGNGNLMNFTMESAFWIFNLVSNFAYTRYDAMYPEIVKVQDEIYIKFIDDVNNFDKKMINMLSTNQEQAIKEITKFSADAADYTQKKWTELFGYLFTKYMDGNIKTPQATPDGYKYYAPKVEQPRYPDFWYKKIVEDHGDKIKAKD
jgi:dipeptidase